MITTRFISGFLWRRQIFVDFPSQHQSDYNDVSESDSNLLSLQHVEDNFVISQILLWMHICWLYYMLLKDVYNPILFGKKQSIYSRRFLHGNNIKQNTICLAMKVIVSHITGQFARSYPLHHIKLFQNLLQICSIPMWNMVVFAISFIHIVSDKIWYLN